MTAAPARVALRGRPARLGDRPVRTVFLDRDGTLNVKAPEGAYVERPQDLVLLPGAAAAVRRLVACGVRTVLVTNQRWLARAGADPAAYRAVHERFVGMLAAQGARLDAVYHCPHERGTCACRKPAPGMLLTAAVEHGFDLDTSVIVGDSLSDVAAGRAAGTGAILLRARASQDTGSDTGVADAVAPDLAAAVELMLSA